MGTMEWVGCECHDPGESGRGWSAEHDGYTTDVHPEDGEFFWRVDATMARSEWPELQGCGFTKTEATAKAAAETAARVAAKSWRAR